MGVGGGWQVHVEVRQAQTLAPAPPPAARSCCRCAAAAMQPSEQQPHHALLQQAARHLHVDADDAVSSVDCSHVAAWA